MEDHLSSNWSALGLLAALIEFRRIDDGSDLLAFRLAGEIPQRSVYVYLYGEDPAAIHFDLEDESEIGEWDQAVKRGAVRSVAELRTVLHGWLQGKD